MMQNLKMNKLIPFIVDGPVKFYKVLSLEEKQDLVKRNMIRSDELHFKIISLHDETKRVIGYDINDTL